MAKFVDRDEDEPHHPSLVVDSGSLSEVGLTAQGQAIGTPAYMAPEQASGRLDLIDRRTDIYGLGARNGSAERILGLSAEQIIGRTGVDPRWRSIHEDGSPFPGEFPVAETLRTGLACSNIIMGVYKPDGALTWISINSEPLFEADGATLGGVVSSFEDITERRRTETALRHASTELERRRTRN